MKTFLSRGSLCFAGGAAGGLTNSIVVWACGALGVSAALGVVISPTLSPGWLYPRLVWGGLWGLLMLLLPARRNLWLGGLAASLAPSAVQLLLVFPLVAHKGWLGLELGTLTPLLVLTFNAVWGLTLAWWLATTDTQRA